MQFTIITTLLAAATVAAAAPAGQRKQIQGGLQCHQVGGGSPSSPGYGGNGGSTWNWGWSSNQEDQNYNCVSSGLLNILSCVSVLDGSNVNIPINLLNL